jgi:hypothetical protein
VIHAKLVGFEDERCCGSKAIVFFMNIVSTRSLKRLAKTRNHVASLGERTVQIAGTRVGARETHPSDQITVLVFRVVAVLIPPTNVLTFAKPTTMVAA